MTANLRFSGLKPVRRWQTCRKAEHFDDRISNFHSTLTVNLMRQLTSVTRVGSEICHVAGKWERRAVKLACVPDCRWKSNVFRSTTQLTYRSHADQTVFLTFSTSIQTCWSFVALSLSPLHSSAPAAIFMIRLELSHLLLCKSHRQNEN